MTTKTVRAVLGNKLLQNANRYFTNSDEAILGEMIQNARRAGASTITFDAVGQDLVITDNGRGLSSEDAQILLTLGGSNNEAEIEIGENAAGIGFFSLAHFDVSVASRDWTMTIPKDAFIGNADATLKSVPGFKAGLTITVRDFLAGKSLTKLATHIRDNTAYSGMTSTLQGFGGELDGDQTPQAFLEMFAGREIAAETETSHGVTIRVCRVHHARDKEVLVNFFGKVIALHRLGSEWIPFTERLAGFDVTDTEKTNILNVQVNNVVLIDVQNTSHLKLQLPERHTIIQDHGIAAIKERVKHLYRRLLLQPGVRNGLSMQDPLRSGFDLPAPSVIVKSIDGSDYFSVPKGLIGVKDRFVPLSDIAAIYASDNAGSESSYIKSLLQSAQWCAGQTPGIIRDNLFDASDLTKAFGDEKIARVTKVTAIVRQNGQEYEAVIDSVDEDDGLVCEPNYEVVGQSLRDSDLEQFNNQLVDEIALSFTVTRPDASTYVLAQPITGLYSNPDCEYQSPDVIITRGKHGDVVWRMLNGIDWWNQESDYDGERNWYQGEYETIVADIAGLLLDHFIGELSDAARDKSYLLRNEIQKIGGELTLTVTIKVDETGYRTVDIVKAEPVAADRKKDRKPAGTKASKARSPVTRKKAA